MQSLVINMHIIRIITHSGHCILLQYAVQFVLLFCVRGNLGEQQESTLRKYCSALRRLIDDTQVLSNQPEIQLQVSEALSLIERDFPLAVQVLKIA